MLKYIFQKFSRYYEHHNSLLFKKSNPSCTRHVVNIKLKLLEYIQFKAETTTLFTLQFMYTGLCAIIILLVSHHLSKVAVKMGFVAFRVQSRELGRDVCCIQFGIYNIYDRGARLQSACSCLTSESNGSKFCQRLITACTICSNCDVYLSPNDTSHLNT